MPQTPYRNPLGYCRSLNENKFSEAESRKVMSSETYTERLVILLKHQYIKENPTQVDTNHKMLMFFDDLMKQPAITQHLWGTQRSFTLEEIKRLKVLIKDITGGSSRIRRFYKISKFR